MPKMSKKLIKKFNFFLLFFILSFYSISHSSEKTDDFKTQNLIENIPILSMLIENKRDVVERFLSILWRKEVEDLKYTFNR